MRRRLGCTISSPSTLSSSLLNEEERGDAQAVDERWIAIEHVHDHFEHVAICLLGRIPGAHVLATHLGRYAARDAADRARAERI